MEEKNLIALISFPILVLIFGCLPSLFTKDKIKTWFKDIKKPRFNPPNWIFGPVWTILYIMIGFSGYVFWSRNEEFSKVDNLEWFFYFFQLLLNFTWTPIFFGINNLFLALLNIIFLDISTFINIILFSQKSYLAGILLIPYMLWISFATYLNYSIWYLNKDTKFRNEEKNE
jgi:benzodiazapine receptor